MRALAGREDAVEHRGELVDHVLDRVALLGQVGRVPVAGQVDDHEPVAILEQRDDGIPGVPTVADPVDEDDGGSGPGDAVIQIHAPSITRGPG